MSSFVVTDPNGFQVPADGQCRYSLILGYTGVGNLDNFVAFGLGSSKLFPTSFITASVSIQQVYLDINGVVQAQQVTQANKTSFPANSVAICLCLVDEVGRIHEIDDYRGSDGNITAPIKLKSGKTI
jgi:hypothetical protein